MKCAVTSQLTQHNDYFWSVNQPQTQLINFQIQSIRRGEVWSDYLGPIMKFIFRQVFSDLAGIHALFNFCPED